MKIPDKIGEVVMLKNYKLHDGRTLKKGSKQHPTRSLYREMLQAGAIKNRTTVPEVQQIEVKKNDGEPGVHVEKKKSKKSKSK